MGARKKICILGGGISGLVAAYELSKEHEVTLIEKKREVGGWLETLEEEGFFFEKGPRTFPTRRSQPLLALAEELGLQGEIIPTAPAAKKRYLWYQGRLEKVPMSPLSALRSPLTQGVLSHLLFKEWRIPAADEDETVWEFAKRRLGSRTADLLFDPLMKGVFGGDAKQLSIEACLPFLKALERQHGSLIKGLMKSRREKFLPPAALEKSPLFTFRSGVRTLLSALSAHISGEVAFEESVLKLEYRGGKWEILTNKRAVIADCIVSALPAPTLGELFKALDAPLSAALKSIPYLGLTLVHLGWSSQVLKQEGFGYLVPTCEGECVLGSLFDSSIFPQHNRGALQTRLTVLLAEDAHAPERAAVEALAKHVRIEAKPTFLRVSKAPSAIPQYRLGHIETIARIREGMKERFPSFFLCGSYVQGVSVSECIRTARLAAEEAKQFFKEHLDPRPEGGGREAEAYLVQEGCHTVDV